MQQEGGEDKIQAPVESAEERKIDETDPEASLKHMTKGRYIRNWVGFLFLGLINNLFYVLVNSSSQRLCADFHKENWIGAILWCNIAFGLVARIIHMFFLEETSFTSRFVAKAIGDVIGVSCLIISIILGDKFFPLSLLGVIFVGTSSSFGETVALCYLKKFPSDLVGGWSSGTGFAGVTGTLLYTLFITPCTIFSITSPLIIFYVIIYIFLIKLPDGEAQREKEKKQRAKEEKDRKKRCKEYSAEDQKTAHIIVSDDNEDSSINTADETTPLNLNAHPKDIEQDQPLKESGGARLKRCIKLVWWPSLNLILVYFLEYVACTGGSDRAQGGDFKHDPNWFVRNCYVILNFCYQLGVVLSRSSLALFKIKRIGILTFLQFVNFVFWLIQADIHFVQGYPIIWFLFVHMFYVGLLGGSSYVNVFYLVLHDDKIPIKDREYCVNISAFANTFGITASSIVIIILDLTLWKRSSIDPGFLSSSSSF